jgi:hypothetical protein
MGHYWCAALKRSDAKSSCLYAHGESIEEMHPQVNWDVVAVLRPANAYRLHGLFKQQSPHPCQWTATRAKSI